MNYKFNPIVVTLDNNPFKEGDMLKFDNRGLPESKYKDVPGINGKQFTIKVDKKWFDHERLIIPAMTQTLVEITKIYPRTWWRRLKTRLGLKTKLFDCRIVHKSSSL